MRSRVLHRWIGRVALALLVPPLLIEASLQAASLWASWRISSTDRDGGGRCAVLCVGDSFTWGLGATGADGSYLAQLEMLLAQRLIDGASRVVNGGWPGRNSRIVLEQLPPQDRKSVV